MFVNFFGSDFFGSDFFGSAGALYKWLDDEVIMNELSAPISSKATVAEFPFLEGLAWCPSAISVDAAWFWRCREDDR